MVENLPTISGEAEVQVWSLDWEDPQRRKWQPTPVLLSGNPMDRGAWRATVHGVTKSWNNWAMEHTHTHRSSNLMLGMRPWGPERGRTGQNVGQSRSGTNPRGPALRDLCCTPCLALGSSLLCGNMSRMIPWLLKVKMFGRDTRPGTVMPTQGWKQGVDLWLQEREQKANARRVRSPYGEMWQ